MRLAFLRFSFFIFIQLQCVNFHSFEVLARENVTKTNTQHGLEKWINQ